MKAFLRAVLRSEWKRWALLSGTFFFGMLGLLTFSPIEGMESVWSLKFISFLAAISGAWGYIMGFFISYQIERWRRKALEVEVAQLKNEMAARG
ncbi:MAG: hypothetical protein JWP35_3637 [Caulobacter sp.]|nr:hypothetical protein [Caulobacter sp.]